MRRASSCHLHQAPRTPNYNIHFPLHNIHGNERRAKDTLICFFHTKYFGPAGYFQQYYVKSQQKWQLTLPP